jgi:UDP-glucose 4-epimerase
MSILAAGGAGYVGSHMVHELGQRTAWLLQELYCELVGRQSKTAIKNCVRHVIFSSTSAVYGNPAQVPATEDTLAAPISPSGSSKLMTEI